MSQRRNVLGVMVSPVDLNRAVQEVVDAALVRRPLGVSALAVHGLMTAVGDPALQYRLNRLEMVVPDGQPLRWALNLLHGTKLADKVPGPDLMLEVCRRAAQEGLSVYLYGSSPKTLELLEAKLTERCPGLRIAGNRPSRFRLATEVERTTDLKHIEESSADLVFVGLGCPRQEIWAYENRQVLSRPVLAVGAAFDYLAGTLTRAPRWMQWAGLEWLHRLRLEPGRLWRRYLLLNPAYLALLAVQALDRRHFPAERALLPPELLRPS